MVAELLPLSSDCRLVSELSASVVPGIILARSFAPVPLSEVAETARVLAAELLTDEPSALLPLTATELLVRLPV